ncbi:TB2/DP1/HVA22-related protein [Macleaya cordata]|uniref:HVA22-like protein n=1 Tax=Macleaya cordata TaxID=56857 RepID=A0A200Q9I4_MACCD|nr:TB2/DP1/HVA22-related protein [Macleaya cordata]
MLVGYAYPAFECYKTVEKNKIEIEQLRFWCQYWIIVAIITVSERFADVFVSWLPMYGELKLAFFIYLWHPKTKGTSYVYGAFLRPYLSKHETDIDRKLQELQARAWDLAILYWQNCTTYGQTTFFQILQYLAAQSSRAKDNAIQKAVDSQLSGAPPNAASSFHQQSKKQSPSPSVVINRSVLQRTKAETVIVQENFPADQKHSSSSSEPTIVNDHQTNNTAEHKKNDSDQDNSTTTLLQDSSSSLSSSGMDETLRSALTRLRRSNSRPQQ